MRRGVVNSILEPQPVIQQTIISLDTVNNDFSLTSTQNNKDEVNTYYRHLDIKEVEGRMTVINNVNTKIDFIELYIINLKERTDRMNSIKKQFFKVSMNFKYSDLA